ncbi:MAG: exodeoxyribonuclease VII small subunit [Kiritimatiellia bacterium]|jgi:exodeoxyribonuclease VII small subunit
MAENAADKTPGKAAGKKNDQALGFEDALTRLESIVGQMESGKLSLDDMIKHFEEGSGLVKSCSSKLDEVERKIEKLVRKEGEITTAPFEEGASGPS